jgi:glycosyltransferase involved in cell wall biosynthesis
MNYLRSIDRSEFSFSITANEPANPQYIKELEQYGCNVYIMPDRKKSLVKYIRKYNEILKSNFNIVHVHGNSATMAIELSLAKFHNVKTRIAHCHNSECDHPIMHVMLNPLFRKSYTDAMACSSIAGNWIFGENKFTILNNAIAVEKYVYNHDNRTTMREKFELNSDLVIGQIARMNEQKNHYFTLNVFEKVKELKPNSKLVLVGTGPLYQELTNYINKLSYKNDILLLGERKEIPELMQMLDIFILPSKWEGLGMVLIEAQAAGLPCFVSEAIPESAKMTDFLQFIDLNVSADVWAKRIVDYIQENRESDSSNAVENIRKKMYDIRDVNHILKDAYLKR